jgi:diguanylate cyclase (GGDEF)-like protein/PAS domain S-box-containing protein
MSSDDDPSEVTAVIPAAAQTATDFGNLVEGSPYAVLVHVGGRVVYANSAAVRWTDSTSVDKMLGVLITDFVHPEAILAAVTTQSAESGQTGEPTVAVTSTLIRRDGTTTDIEAVTVPTTWEGSNAYQTVLRDVSTERSARAAASRRDALIRHAAEAIIATTEEGLVTEWNLAAEALYGVAAGDALGRPICDSVGAPLDLAEVLAGGGSCQATHYTATGSVLSVRVSAAAVETGYLLICVDHSAEYRLAKHFQSVVTSLDRGIVVIRRDGTVASINPAAIRILGFGAGRFPDTHAERSVDYPVFDTDGRVLPSEQRPTNVTLRTGQPIRDRVLGLRRHDGYQAWISFTTALLDPANPDRSPVLLSLSDVTTEHLTNQQLWHSAHHDALTGLPNRARTLAMITAAITPSDNPQLAALMFIDIDQLKRVNDSLGHLAGDLVLQTCAERLQGAIRTTDTLTRVGGDEFVLLIAARADTNDLHQLAQRLHAALMNTIVVHQQPITVTASIGIAVVDTNQPESPNDILRRADAAMYQAKANGPGQTRFYTSPASRRH